MPGGVGLFLDALRAPEVPVVGHQRQGGELPPRARQPVKVGVCANLRGQHASLVGDRSNDARLGDPDRPGVNFSHGLVIPVAAAGRGVPVGRVADFRTGCVGRQGEVNRLPLVKTARQTEMHRIHAAGNGGGAVGRARRRLREIDPFIVFVEAVADAGGLLGEFDLRHGAPRRLRAAQREVLAVGVELEIRVRRLGQTGALGVLAGGENHHATSSSKRHVGENPLGQVFPIIGQRPSLEVHPGVAAVVQFDPVTIHPLVSLGGSRAELTDHHVAGGVGRVNLDRPGLAVERVGCLVEVCDAVVICPAQFHLAKRDVVELKHIRPGTEPVDGHGRDAVGHEVGRVDALHRLVEPDLRLAELADLAIARHPTGKAGWHQVQQVVAPGGFMVSGVSLRVKGVRRGGLVSNTVARRPPDIGFPGGGLVELKGECISILLQLGCRVIVDHQVAGIHPGHRFAEGNGDDVQLGQLARLGGDGNDLGWHELTLLGGQSHVKQCIAVGFAVVEQHD